MQLHDLVTPIDKMSDEELLERIRKLRHKRDVVRPAAKKHVERAAKKGIQSRLTKAEDLFNNLSDEERAEILKALGEG